MRESSRRINLLAKLNSTKTYLEIGVETGGTFFEVEAAHKVGVDKGFLFDTAEHETDSVKFFKQTSDEFFQGNRKEFDFVFIDGLHSFEQVLRDFMNTLVFTNENSIILIDDVVPSDVYSTLPGPFEAVEYRERAGSSGNYAWHGDVFKLIFFIHDFVPTLSFATFAGGLNSQTVVWRECRASFTPIFNNLELISRLSYFDFEKRKSVMNFVSEEEIGRKIKDFTLK